MNPLKPLAIFALVFATPVTAQEPAGDIDTSALDRSIRIQDDLYQHVNGTWLKTTEIPNDKSNYGSFIKLADLSQQRIRSLVERVAKGEHDRGTDQQKVGDFYKSFMDEELANRKGVEPLQSELRKISQLNTREEIWDYMGQLGKLGAGGPVGFFVSQDAKNSSRYICQLIQSGTTLPDRDYYLSQDENSAEARTALRSYIRKLFDLASIENSDLAAEQILDLETKLAEISWERVKLRDAEKRYNKHTFEELQQRTPGLDWASFFQAAEVKRPEEINVNTPSFFEGLETLLDQTPKETLVRYLQYKLIDAYAPYLSEDFVAANFGLYGRQLGGIPEQKPRWKRAVEATAGAGAGDFGVLGEVVGRLYVDKYFKPEAKARMEELVDNLLLAFGQSIDDLTWMSDETKVKAQEKLSKIGTKIGYPNRWRDYSKLEIEADDLVGNIKRSNYVEYRRNIDKLGKPIDREEWGMTPQTVNAYYNPTKNEIVFPAAILQPPFFSMKALDALNYGGIGAVIGHEISHAFDDQGSRYDGEGNLNNWWTEADEKAFKKLTSQLVAQYETYEPLPGKNVNGKLTLGENIADLSGLTIAHKAYAIAREGKEPESKLGWNGDQLFFVGWSRVWQRKYRDAEMVKRLLTDPHSPSRFRANGPVMNIEAFYTAFGVKKGDALFKPESERIKIW
jgi:putative endopeptidase